MAIRKERWYDKVSDKEEEKYPVEPIADSEPANEEDVKEALEELNPSDDSMDDNRG